MSQENQPLGYIALPVHIVRSAAKEYIKSSLRNNIKEVWDSAEKKFNKQNVGIKKSLAHRDFCSIFRKECFENYFRINSIVFTGLKWRKQCWKLINASRLVSDDDFMHVSIDLASMLKQYIPKKS